MPYRKRNDRDVWHFCTNCSNWPTVPGTYTERTSRPTTGEFDNECRSKNKDNDCRGAPADAPKT